MKRKPADTTNTGNDQPVIADAVKYRRIVTIIRAWADGILSDREVALKVADIVLNS